MCFLETDCSTAVSNERPMIAVPVKVVDVTGREGEFSLDKQGFEFRIWPSAYHAAATASGGGDGASFEDPAAIKRGYYAECEGFLQDLYGICFFLLSLPISPLSGRIYKGYR